MVAGGIPYLTDFSTGLQFIQHAMTTAVQKMGTKGQVTLPKRVREALGLKAGDLLETVLTPEGALTRPVELKPKKVDALEDALADAEADVQEGQRTQPHPV